jgi:hypothetical protein
MYLLSLPRSLEDVVVDQTSLSHVSGHGDGVAPFDATRNEE